MNRDMGFFTKHAEKLILGLAILVLLGVGAYAWLGVFGELHEDPGKVKQRIEEAATQVEARLASAQTNLPGRDEYVVPDYASEFADQYNTPVTEADELAVKLEGPGFPTLEGVGEIGYEALYLPTPPVAASFSLKTKHAVLASPNAVNDAQLQEMLVEVRPIVDAPESGDFQYVSVMAEFPLRDWAERVDAVDQPALNQIPDNVWFNKLGIAAVYLIREEQLADGSWGNQTVIDPLPGQPAFMPEERVEPNPLAAGEALELALGLQPDITQPMFPPTVHEAWTPPTGRDRILSADEKKQLQDIESDIRRLERRLDQLTGVDRRANQRQRGAAQRRPQRGGGDDMGGMGMDMMGGGAGIRRQPRDAGRDRAAQQRDREQEQIQKVQDELLEAQRQRAELLGLDEDEATRGFMSRGRTRMGMGMDAGMGMDMGMGMGMDMGMDGGMARGNMARQRNLQNVRGGLAVGAGTAERLVDQVPETIRIWAHDLTVRPGKTYRYKLVAAAINPLFQYTRIDRQQRSENEYKLALAPTQSEIDAAPWTTPVTMDPEAYFFFVRGNADQDRATIEVWKVYDGQWRQGEFEETPGNPIGGSQRVELLNGLRQTVDMGVGSVLLDIDTVEVNNTPQVRMVYLGSDGQIASRLLREDRGSLKRKELEETAEETANLRQPLAVRQ